MSRPFATAQDFRRSLEERLKRQAFASGRALERERQLVIFERYLARLFNHAGADLVVKGGLALELRTAAARTTKDIDLRAMGAPSDLRELARDAGRRDAGDFLSFEVEPHPRHPAITADGMRYEGHRYRAQAHLAGKVYGNPFSIDVAFGEPILGAPELIRGRADLSFAGLEPPELRVYPRATHVAEKLHAYTLPRPSLNSRTKDLPDIAILASIGDIEASVLREALAHTFSHRATHALPRALPPPPGEWAMAYARMVAGDGLRWKDLAQVHAAAAAFIDPVLSDARGLWDPRAWRWFD